VYAGTLKRKMPTRGATEASAVATGKCENDQFGNVIGQARSVARKIFHGNKYGSDGINEDAEYKDLVMPMGELFALTAAY